jgi:hypothetical protein
MNTQRAHVTNPDHYISTVIISILVACIGALVFGFVAGQGF